MMRSRKSTITFIVLLCTCLHVVAQNNMRIRPVPPPKKTPATQDNAPLNPKMFFMLILRAKPFPPAEMTEFVAKEYNNKAPGYDLKKMDPDLFKVFKSPNLSVLPVQFYALQVNGDDDRKIPSEISFTIPGIVMPPPEVDPVQTLAMRNAKNDEKQTAVGGIQASKVAVPKAQVPIPEADPELAKNANGTPNLTDRTPVPSKRKNKKGYKNIVFEKTVAKEEPAPTLNNNNTSTTAATETAQPSNPNFNPNLPIIYDTIRSSGRRRRVQEEEMVVTSHHDTIYIVPGDYEDYVETSVKPQPRPSVMKDGSCGCMEMEMKAQDTINFEDYVNYGFTFKNNCKEFVYVHSFSFRFSVYETTGYPAKRLRRIDFVKRFDYPEFVKIKPGQSFEYRFADDPFFEYELVRGKQYKFTFMYNNYNNKYPSAPQQTHLCNDPRDKVIYVQ